jgi:hypothetical protein
MRLLRTLPILTASLVLLSAPAYAIPCRDDACQKKARVERRGPSPTLQSLELVLVHPVMRPFSVWGAQADGLRRGISKRSGPPPGLRARLDEKSRWRTARSAPPMAIPTRETDSASAAAPIPEPTSLLLFGSGLLIARIGMRRRREVTQRSA